MGGFFDAKSKVGVGSEFIINNQRKCKVKKAQEVEESEQL